jgi:hypothetical protein
MLVFFPPCSKDITIFVCSFNSFLINGQPLYTFVVNFYLNQFKKAYEKNHSNAACLPVGNRAALGANAYGNR